MMKVNIKKIDEIKPLKKQFENKELRTKYSNEKMLEKKICFLNMRNALMHRLNKIKTKREQQNANKVFCFYRNQRLFSGRDRGDKNEQHIIC